MLKTTVEVRGAAGALDRIPPAVSRAVEAKVRALTLNLQSHVVRDKLQGQVLNHRSGALSRSIQQDVNRSGSATIGRVFSSGDVKYAGIHEFGGQTPPHEILPNKAKALSFLMEGKRIFAQRVQHPGSKMPERSFLRSSLGDMAEEIILGIRQAATQAAKAAQGS
jgi:phage gpG-like protein